LATNILTNLNEQLPNRTGMLLNKHRFVMLYFFFMNVGVSKKWSREGLATFHYRGSSFKNFISGRQWNYGLANRQRPPQSALGKKSTSGKRQPYLPFQLVLFLACSIKVFAVKGHIPKSTTKTPVYLQKSN